MPDIPHINQPGGRFRASTHPNIAGRERELRSLADAVRRLVSITVTNTASRAETAAAAAEIHQLADALERHVPAVPPFRYAGRSEDMEPHDHFQYDVMLGLYNPLALPMEMSWEAPVAIGVARFTTPYEGPPGCVHGAVIAGAFDQVFNIANLMSGSAGPTAELTLRYRNPTPLHKEIVFEAQVQEVDGRKIRTTGRLRYGDTVTVEASGLFIGIGSERAMTMAPRDDE